jgi:hypothetical protein
MRINWEDDERPVLIARLGLDESASDEQIQEGMATLLTASEENPPPANPPANPPADPGVETPPSGNPPEDNPPADPPEEDPTEGLSEEDTIVVDVAAFRSLQQRASLTARLQEEDRIGRRENLIAAAIREGKFPPSRRAHYEARYDSDPDNTEKTIKRMIKGMVPIEERGVDAVEDETEDPTAYPSDWVPDVAARAANANQPQNGNAATIPVQVPARRSRVQTED